ncbi:MAG: M48 family metalloprotease [Deltaproteobacteria bacterium]|nr:M48 family metalloprotease [Deltaproteobacteria bacterium]
MYGNFIYFIVVLLIYTTYRPGDEANFPLLQTLIYFACLTLGFALITGAQFRRLESVSVRMPPDRVGHKFDALLRRQTIMAIVVFAVDVYGLNLSYYTSIVKPLKMVPTLEAVVFLLLFMGHMALVWAMAHRLYRRLYRSSISCRAYVMSNLMFAVPILLPWFLLSLVSDLIYALPFDAPKQMLATPQGEIAYFLLFLLAAALFGPAIIQQFWQCRPLQPGIHRTRIETLCRNARLGYKNILMWPIFEGRIITAGVMGLVKRFRYILVTDALLAHLSPEEIDAVVAHEIGHVKRKHLLLYLLFFAGYMFISYTLFDLVIYASIYAKPFIVWLQRAGMDQTVVMPATFSIFIILAFLLYFRYVFGYFMRNFERQADIYVFDLLGTAVPLVTTLQKIAAASGQPSDKPNWHHFSIKERTDYLKRCILDRSWIARHNLKVRRSLLVYAVGIFILGIMGYQISFGEAGKRLDSHFYEKIILQELEKAPGNADLYTMLGDLYYHKGNLSRAGRAYEHALTISPGNVRALNNLAWLYATAEDVGMRNPGRSLQLAEKAATLEQAPYILDTLAESYFVNGFVRKAILSERKALSLATGDKRYYEGQLRKFEAVEKTLY